MKPNLNSKDLVRFPKGLGEIILNQSWKTFSVTICMNGMHSTRKIKERYPGYLPIIRELYTGFFNERYFNGDLNVESEWLSTFETQFNWLLAPLCDKPSLLF